MNESISVKVVQGKESFVSDYSSAHCYTHELALCEELAGEARKEDVFDRSAASP